MFKRVAVIGLGLIGGSLALAIKESRLAKEVVGVSRRKSTVRYAIQNKMVNCATLDLKKGIRDSDLVIIATAVFKIVDIAKKITPLLKKGAVLTDTGSTKEYILKNIEPLMPKGIYFVGSHPLAGSEKSGIRHSDEDLFKEAFCILTKTDSVNPKALNKVKRFWDKLGMKVIVMEPGEHDRIVSKLSHLPHAAAVSLVNSAGRMNLKLAAGGFKDTTRIALSEPELWKDIFLTNRKNLIRDIEILKRELSKIESALKRKDIRALLKLLKRAKVIRDSL